MQDTQKENESAKNWFRENWLNLVIFPLLGTIFGMGGGAGIVATKGVQAQGMTEEKADVRYLSNAEAQRLIEARNRQMEEIKRDLKSEIDKTLKKETFDIWQKNWDERQKYFDEKLDRILEK